MTRWERARSAGGKLALLILAPLAVLALLEGAASLLLFVRDLADTRPETVAETRHSRYDAELGWLSEANVAIADMYGPGRALHTNGRGFRGRAEVADSVPADRRRVICSGDSFTLGFGVGDGDTWCALLASLDTMLETVNMGQGGYGLDQAYLWYRRDGMRLAHDVQVFAYITDDFRRMKEGRFLGYGKPQLALRGDSLVVTNVPAPRNSRGSRWLTANLETLRRLRLVQLTNRLAGRSRDARADSLASDSAIADVVGAVIRDLARFHRDRGSRLIVAHLAVPQDRNTNLSTAWRRSVRTMAEREGVTFVDLVEPLRQLHSDSVSRLFIPWGSTEYAGGGGHYTAAGNRWAAEHLLAAVRDAARPAPPRR